VRTLKNYVAFILKNKRLLAFGFLMAFFSSFGQTYFIALFGDDIRNAFALSHSGFGLMYSCATLASGLMLIWVGRLIDRMDLRRFTLVVCAGMILGCVAMAVSPVVAALLIALFLLRFFGQGLLGHISMTSMARYFEHGRGKAISIAALGYPAGEALLPIVAVSMIAVIGWRESWWLIGLALSLVMIPMTLWLLRGHARRHARLLANAHEATRADSAGGRAIRQRQWTFREVVRDVRFYMLLPAVLAPPMIGTGMFFHAAHLVEFKGWTMPWYAACFVGFAATQLPSSLLSGPVIDRIGATRMLPLFLLPMICSLLLLSSSDHMLIALLYLMLFGMTMGMTSTTVNAGWAELYGVLHLGSIRALAASLMVFSTALAPGGFGLLIDIGVTMNAIALGGVVYGVLASLLARHAAVVSPMNC
jgi:MFS family permease